MTLLETLDSCVKCAGRLRLRGNDLACLDCGLSQQVDRDVIDSLLERNRAATEHKSALVQVRPAGRRIRVICPFHPEFMPAIAGLSGIWARAMRCWTFDQRDEEKVRAVLVAIFGHDGSEPVPLVDVELTTHRPVEATAQGIYFAGRAIANSRGRDDEASLGWGVARLEGDLPVSGGSSKYWTTTLNPGIYEIRDLPEPALADSPACLPIAWRHAETEWRLIRRHPIVAQFEMFDPPDEQEQAISAISQHLGVDRSCAEIWYEAIQRTFDVVSPHQGAQLQDAYDKVYQLFH